MESVCVCSVWKHNCDAKKKKKNTWKRLECGEDKEWKKNLIQTQSRICQECFFQLYSYMNESNRPIHPRSPVNVTASFSSPLILFLSVNPLTLTFSCLKLHLQAWGEGGET